VNYPGLSADVAELFAEVQGCRPPWWEYRRVLGRASAAPSSSIAPLVNYDRGTCARCGDPVELRPGVRDPVHLGPPMSCADRRLRAAR
jgi:hypothetical protein